MLSAFNFNNKTYSYRYVYLSDEGKYEQLKNHNPQIPLKLCAALHTDTYKRHMADKREPIENIINRVVNRLQGNKDDEIPKTYQKYPPNHPMRRMHAMIDEYVAQIYISMLERNKHTANIDGMGYFVTDDKKYPRIYRQNLRKIASDLKKQIYKLPPNADIRMVSDVFGNIRIFDIKQSLRRPRFDKFAPQSINGEKYDFEHDQNALAYRNLVINTLQNPGHQIAHLSNAHYGVYEAHDHKPERPHLLIIPKHKKYKNFVDLIKNGSNADIIQYLDVMKKIASLGPRKKKLESELFLSDTGKHQKVPFFYGEYIPRMSSSPDYNTYVDDILDKISVKPTIEIPQDLIGKDK